jgi:hypothetical protein
MSSEQKLRKGACCRTMKSDETAAATREYCDAVANKWDEMRRTFFGEGVRDAAIALQTSMHRRS